MKPESKHLFREVNWIRAWPVSGIIMEELRIESKESDYQELIQKWLEIGNNNPWIRDSYDPPFTKESFYRCDTLEELYFEISKGNWCLAQAFYLGNIAFINQVDGGDEWLVIRGALPFESITVRRFKPDEFSNFYNRCIKATDEELTELMY
ncbi:hypothetical protein SAMN05660649_04245 [Desulfotomaculum arcticum]|uniref:Uncharacterized protein n=2 Tax=Desulfotruncus TaxID=2867377 RepID=A0A1I2Y8X1_9FIRM|nr:hypothetical protein SAMN05660649_04245 [Desulfotomaculum arcticum] [Desulfotruncus arcticus DSM 17038]